jgi:hypothetical protein
MLAADTAYTSSYDIRRYVDKSAIISWITVTTTYPEIVRLVVRKNDNDLVFLPERGDELRDITTAPVDESCLLKDMRLAAYLRLSRMSSSFSILCGLLVASTLLRASLTL